MDSLKSKINPVCLLSCLGITSMILWCKLMGHTSGFFVPLTGLGEWANARVFWLVGILIGAIYCTVRPNEAERMDAVQRYVVPLIAVAGAMSFALAFYQDLFNQRMLAMLGIVVSGFGYFWFISSFVLLLGRTQGISALAGSFTGAFVLRELLLLIMDATIPTNYQVMVAIALPLASIVFLSTADNAAKAWHASHDTPTAWAPPNKNEALVSIVSAALLLSVARACSISGTWGTYHSGSKDIIADFIDLSVYALTIAALVYAGVVRLHRTQTIGGGLIGMLVVVTGLFIGAYQDSFAWLPHPLLAALVETNDPFALVFFWTSVATAFGGLKMAPRRTVGIAGIAYSAASVIWVFVINHDNALDSAFVLVIVYAVFCFVVILTLVQGRRGSAQPTVPEDSEQPASEASAEPLMFAVRVRCAQLASEYSLSPRELEVLTLMAQGRTSGDIQEELSVAASTVKTHTQHLYTKLGVTDKQGLMDLILG